METIQYIPQGVCSKKMEIDVEEGVIQAVRVLGGCSGNLQGICSLLKGMPVEDAIARLDGNTLWTEVHLLPGSAGPGAKDDSLRAPSAGRKLKKGVCRYDFLIC